MSGNQVRWQDHVIKSGDKNITITSSLAHELEWVYKFIISRIVIVSTKTFKP